MHAFLRGGQISLQVSPSSPQRACWASPVTSFVTLLGGAAVAISFGGRTAFHGQSGQLLRRCCSTTRSKVGDYVEVDGPGRQWWTASS